MKKITTTIVFSICFLAGLSLLLYPFIANEWNEYRQSRLLAGYEETIASMEAADEIDYGEEWEGAYAYNDALLPYVLPDSFAIAEATGEDAAYMSALNLTGDGMMGYVQIPKINVKLPIFHTTSEEVLQTAAGHLEGSSLPVGGEGTHAVISAHRGLPSAALFTDLDQMALGDHFLLKILDDTLCYEVDDIQVIEPDDTSALAAVPGEDLVTLLTCTPYGVNSHRLLVRGHRTEYTEAVDEEVAASPFLGGTSLHTSYLLWVLVGLAVTGAFICLLYLYDRKSRRRTAQAAGSSMEPGLEILDLDAEPCGADGADSEETQNLEEPGGEMDGAEAQDPEDLCEAGGAEGRSCEADGADAQNLEEPHGADGAETQDPEEPRSADRTETQDPEELHDAEMRSRETDGVETQASEEPYRAGGAKARNPEEPRITDGAEAHSPEEPHRADSVKAQSHEAGGAKTRESRAKQAAQKPGTRRKRTAQTAGKPGTRKSRMARTVEKLRRRRAGMNNRRKDRQT